MLKKYDAEAIVSGSWDFIEVFSGRKALRDGLTEALSNLAGIAPFQFVRESPPVDVAKQHQSDVPVVRIPIGNKVTIDIRHPNESSN